MTARYVVRDIPVIQSETPNPRSQTVTVKQLIEDLKLYPPDTLVRVMSDPEGNEDRPLHEVGEMGQPEDGPTGFAVVLWPGRDRTGGK